jgi:hypothetical protein
MIHLEIFEKSGEGGSPMLPKSDARLSKFMTAIGASLLVDRMAIRMNVEERPR